MKIVVTGASGFVGKSLIRHLKTLNVETLAVVRDPANSADSDSVYVPEFSANGMLQQAMMDVDVVIHLAARVHVMHENIGGDDVLAEFLKVNLHATSNLAIAAAKAGVKRFVYVSSIKVNGEFTNPDPFTEKNSPFPCDAYAISKWQAEQALHTIGFETGMQVVVIRPPLVYGPGVKANFLNLLKLVNLGIPLPLAAINNKRSLIYVGNLVHALIQCAVHPKATGNTYLVSDGQNVSTPELIHYIANSLQTPARLLNVPLPLMGFVAKLLRKSSSLERLTQSLVIDSSKIRNELGWSPPFTLEQGLAATAAWFKENH